MTDTQYALNSALPFDVSEHDTDARAMLAAAPADVWQRINAAEGPQEITSAFDRLADWISANYHHFFSKPLC